MCEYKSFYKTVEGNEGSKCLYNTRLDTYGCGCEHNCKYCYARSLLSFRGLWNADNPRIANLNKIEKAVKKLPLGSIVRLGGMTDCFQPIELRERITLRTIELLNRYGIRYLIVTKSHIIANQEYVEAMNKQLAHIQISVTTLDDKKALEYENASIPSKRVQAILGLQERNFDVALRLSPLIEEYMDFNALNALSINKCIVEFLRVNRWIKTWLSDIDYDKYTLWHCNYYHLPLDEKARVLRKIHLRNVSVCEDITEHFAYWKNNFNPNKDDCCNLSL